MHSARRLIAVACAALLAWCPHLISAPTPSGASLPPGKRPPTPEELAEACKAYEAIGGRYEPQTHFDERTYHIFRVPPDVKPADYAKIPDLPFEYLLIVDLGPDLTTGTLKQLARLKNLRNLTVRHYRRIDPGHVGNLAPLLAELAAAPNLESLALGLPEQEDVLSDEFADRVLEFKSLRRLAGAGSITNAGLKTLAQHPTLEAIVLGDCPQVTDAGLAHLAKMKKLRRLSLQDCDKPTAAGLKPFTQDPRLTSLSIGGKGMKADALVEVGKIRTLEDLNLCTFLDDGITERDLQPIARLPRLRKFQLPGRLVITDEGLAILANATAIESLYVSGLNLSDKGVKSLLSLERLKRLSLYGATAVTDDELKELAKLPRLETLYLTDAPKVTDEGAKALLASKTLTGLWLERTGVTEKGVRAFVADRGRRLQSLGVHGIPVSDEFVAYLAFQSPNLVWLDLMDCKGVTDRSMNALLSFTKLHHAGVNGTSITAANMKKLWDHLRDRQVSGR